ncbi:MAG: ABC transporter ATP-binding protein [Chloroflexota bacterium]
MAEVKITNLSKRYTPDTPLAVDTLNLDIADGEFLVLLGPSGCGKTTTLRCVAGLEIKTEGDIAIGEHIVNTLPPGDRDIAFVFQFYALYPHLSAYDNIAFPLRAQNLQKNEVDQRVQQVAKLLRIDNILKRRPNSLPSGEQQRVALGRAIIRRPQVFLMDEPLTNLDASLRTDMRVELKHLQADIGTTMIYVTHDQTEALSMAHRIAIMNLGVLQQVGTPLEVYNQPQTLFVAGFIGTPPMNMIDCHLTENDHLSDAQGNFVITNTRIQALKTAMSDTKTPLVFGIRAEDISLTTVPDEGQIQGKILVREPLGDETVYEVEVGDNAFHVKTEPTRFFEPGQNVGLNFSETRMHIFDANSEQVMKV